MTRFSGRRGTPADGEGGGTVEQAKDVSLRLLGDRARSRFELETKLFDRGYTPQVVAAALDRLTEVGLVDDAAFAEAWVYQRSTYSHRGKRALAEELRRKGIDPQLAATALESLDPADEREHARELVAQKLAAPSAAQLLATGERGDFDKLRRRLVGMLARRGFGGSMAYAVVTEALAFDVPEALAADVPEVLADGLDEASEARP